ncbi:MAG TPA: DUF4124 domain-containing protein [Lysobacter sp.]|nr:DUF4124 domain-containing protein [Lysobacter sp.]
MAATPFRTAALALALAGLAAPAAAGEIYQWKDANGVTHYSDSPPPNRAYQNRTIRDRGAPAAAGTGSTAENPDCTNARSNLERLNSSADVGPDRNGDGKPDSVLTPEQRAAQKELMLAAIKVNCAPAAATR